MTLVELQDVISEVIGHPVTLTEQSRALDVVGWDSLNNTLIALELSAQLEIELDGEDLGKCENVGALLQLVQEKTSAV